MYIPAAFRESRPQVLHALIGQHSFATLISQLEDGLFATHLPMLLDPARGEYGTLLGHVARANPHWRAFTADQRESLAIFQGPHAYISPSWYVSNETVPTWNYSAVHAYGRPSVIDDPQRVRALLDRLVDCFESALTPPWSTARVGDEYIRRMSQAIVAFEMPITRLEGKRKLGQNRPTVDIAAAAAGLQANGDALGQALAQQMLDVARA
jgi:transcriptional regulator